MHIKGGFQKGSALLQGRGTAFLVLRRGEESAKSPYNGITSSVSIRELSHTTMRLLSFAEPPAIA